MPKDDLTLRLPDGRIMGYAEYGANDGQPVIACHGTPGCRLMLRPADTGAQRLGLRIISPDRPGYGLSDPCRQRAVAAWPKDVDALANHLGIDRFAMIGISGGGPYALACAALLPTRVRLVASVCGLAPFDRDKVRQALDPRRRALLNSARGLSLLLSLVLIIGGRAWRHAPGWMLRHLVRYAAVTERPVLEKPGTQAMLIECFEEGFRMGGQGVAQDLRLFSRPWGFSLEQIAAPVVLWHGTADGIVPVAMGHYLARHLPGCTTRFIPDAGHYWIIDHVDEILKALLECR